MSAEESSSLSGAQNKNHFEQDDKIRKFELNSLSETSNQANEKDIISSSKARK